MIFFLAVGIALVIAANLANEQLDEACDPGASGLGETFNEIYSIVDEIYCESTVNWYCYIDYTLNLATASVRTNDYDITTDPNDPDGITNVQGCTDQLESIFDDYDIELDGLDEITEFLDLFGDIESAYDCSGICDLMPLYYFSDTSNGEPKKACLTSIQDELLEYAIKGSGIAYIVTGAFIMVIWFIQYGLCCRKNLNGSKANQGQSKQF